MADSSGIVAVALVALAAFMALPHEGLATEPPSGVPTYGCAVPTFDGTWRDRASADQWLPGFYPADEWPRGTVALTFDDGPLRTRTVQILDLLAERGYAATFFVVGHNIDEDTWHLLQRMVREGHIIANHTWRHDTVMYLDRGEQFTVDYIASEYGLTQVMVDLALLASSEEDFVAMRAEVFGDTPLNASRSELVAAWPSIAARHRGLLARRNPATGGSPYPMLYSRAPGGSPYFGSWSQNSRDYFASALLRSGMLNVMWDGSSGDSSPNVDASLRDNLSYLTGNMVSAARQGGVLLIHDRIPHAALVIAFDAFDADDVTVLPLDAMTRDRFSCAPVHLAAVLGVAPPSVLLATGAPSAVSVDATARTEIEQLSSALDAATARVAALEGDLAGTTLALEELRDAAEASSEQLAAASAARDDAQAELARARETVDELERERELRRASDERVADLEHELQRAREEREAMARPTMPATIDADDRDIVIASLRERETELARERDDAIASLRALQSELDRARAELAVLVAQADAATAEARADDTEAARVEIDSAERDRDAAIDALARAEHALAARDAELADLRHAAATADARLAALQAELERARDTIAARDVALQQIGADLAAVDAERDALDQALRDAPATSADGYAAGPAFADEPDVPLCRAVGARSGETRWVPCPR